MLLIHTVHYIIQFHLRILIVQVTTLQRYMHIVSSLQVDKNTEKSKSVIFSSTNDTNGARKNLINAEHTVGVHPLNGW